ncbi:urease subunit beta [Anaerostipes sp.]|uniref:urease subunit beta n=1 Tax=Anaerostipes sp. TaxID=1872530 RepID=UPI0025C052E0|nr:urease subunit beta [Anaerostipes sp.]MBS7007306.1 urease subunit beta [Anaerostipes sp.]
MKPGEMIIKNQMISINSGRKAKTVSVVNKGDRPVQIGSHFHFFEINKFLQFNREETFGYRLDIPAGTAVRFEPDEVKEVNLIMISGKRRISGFNNLTEDQINGSTKQKALKNAEIRGF